MSLWNLPGGLVALVLVALYGALAFWTGRRLRALRRIEERMSRLADGVALLTDTTESGLSTVIREVEHLRGRPGGAKAGGRAAVSRRVARAARTGQDVGAIAASERLSESEVRLHLSMAEAARERRSDAGATAQA
ncbi:MAG: hypothetical protein R2752_05995 [Vicinamibacterales bacterium]